MMQQPRKGGGGRAKPATVDETYKIRIAKRIEEFRDSEEQVLVFPPGLDNQERKYVHEICLKLGLRSKSTGTGESRYLTVKKPDASEMKAEDGIPCLKLLPACTAELNAYFAMNPISQKESDFVWGRGNIAAMLGSKEFAAVESKKKQTTTFKANAAVISASATSVVPPVIPSRKALPIWRHRDEILDCILKSDVTIISGETGSGKSTQVVQYVLDHLPAARIVCTQPRRLPAIALAERVAEERGQSCGSQIGYSVRFESSFVPETRCLFCTTGVALSSLRNGLAHSGLLQGLTHLFIDEVHERDRNTDFLLIYVKELLLAQSKPDWKAPRIKIVLMSATLSVKAFLNYFSGGDTTNHLTCSTVAVEGSSFTVHPLFLEDVLAECKDFVKNTLRLDHSVGVSLSNLNVDDEKGFDAATFFLQQQTPKKLRCPLCGMGAKSVEEFGAHAATCQGSLGVSSSPATSLAKGSEMGESSVVYDENVWEDVWGDDSQLQAPSATPVVPSRVSSTIPHQNDNQWEDVWGVSPSPSTPAMNMDESTITSNGAYDNGDDEEREQSAENVDDEDKANEPKSGVSFDQTTQKFRVTLVLEGQAMDLGLFDSKEAADEKYLRALGKWSSAAEVEEGELEVPGEEMEKREADPELQVVLDRYLRSREGEDETEADIDLIVALVEQIDHAGTNPSRFFRSHLPGDERIDKDDDASAILIFLAGWGEITALCDALQQHPKFGNERYYQVLPLHSGIPSKDQRRVFQRPPKGVRKIVCATNIAETSLTIEDVVYVIDTGLVKEKGYDSFTRTSSLLPHFVSKASARQRRGRAGRCRTGVCFHLYSKMRFDTMVEHQVPEILRTPLEEMCLHAKSIISSSREILPPDCSVADFLLKALDPPSLKSILSAVQTLQSLGGLDANENLTALGRFLSSLPVEPRLGKTILYGAFLKACGPAITLSVSSGFRDPFVLLANPVLKTKATAVRQRLARAMPEMGLSDHVAILTCFREFCFHKSVAPGTLTPHGTADPRKYCNDQFLSYACLDSLQSMRKQVAVQLGKEATGLFDRQSPDHPTNNVHARNSAVLSALLCSATFPNLAIYRAKTMRWMSAGHKRIRPHPSSCITPQYLKSLLSCGEEDESSSMRVRLGRRKQNQHLQDKFFVFEELIRNAKGSAIRVLTNVDPLVLVLFGGSLNLFGADEDSFHLEELKGESEDDDMEMDEKTRRSMNSALSSSALIKINSWAKLMCDKVHAERLAVLRLRFETSLMAGVERGFFNVQDKDMANMVIKVMSSQIMSASTSVPPPVSSLSQRQQQFPQGGPRPMKQAGATRQQPQARGPRVQPTADTFPAPTVTPIQPIRQPRPRQPPRGPPTASAKSSTNTDPKSNPPPPPRTPMAPNPNRSKPSKKSSQNAANEASG